MQVPTLFTHREPIGSSTFPMPDLPIDWQMVMRALHNVTTSPAVATMYLHIPFCDQICSFCGFNKSVSAEDVKAEYVASLIDEIRLYGESAYVQSLSVEAVYFGGGTPNCLSAGQLDEILQAVHRYAPLTADCEITCEGVIQNFDAERMAAIKAGGVNRVSAGIQTFNGAIRQAHLHMLNDKSALLEAIARVRTQFTNFNLDFIYNLPGQDDTIWDDDLATAVSVGATHLTAYPLVLLERTAFYSDYVKTKKLPMPDEQREIDMFGKTLDAMSMAGYTDYYSVRDWAKPGFACRYIRLNAEGNHVLALGAGAHGYLAGITYRNTANVAAYIAQMKGRTLPLAAMREATAREQMDRFMVMGLRMRQFDMSRFTARFGAAADSVYRDKIAAMIDGGYLERKMDQLRFTPLGDIYANNVRTYFESNKTASVGYADTLGIDNSGKTHYARISRVKATDAESPL